MDKSTVTIRIMGDALIPDEITAILGCKPSTSYSKGEVFHAKSGDIIRRTGVWYLETKDCEPANLDAQVADILDKLSQNLTAWASLSSKYEIDLFCGLFMKKSNEGLEVSSETLRALGERGVSLSLDIYDPVIDERAQSLNAI